MTRERIEDMREVVLPFVKKRLLETNYEGLGKSDAEEFEREFNEILNLAIKALEQEPKTGHWVLGGYDDNYYICDRCNYTASEYYFEPHYNYCPNCGCRMVELQESEDKE